MADLEDQQGVAKRTLGLMRGSEARRKSWEGLHQAQKRGRRELWSGEAIVSFGCMFQGGVGGGTGWRGHEEVEAAGTRTPPPSFGGGRGAVGTTTGWPGLSDLAGFDRGPTGCS